MRKSFLRCIAAVLSAMMLCLVMASCSVESGAGANTASGASESMVGISMPEKETQRWERDGANIKTGLEASGYKTMLEFANNSPSDQVTQIENMINAGCDALIIAAVDSASLTTVLETAKSKGIYVIAYDRLITDTKNVDFYVTFDNFKVGTEMASYIEKTLDLKNAAGPFNLEIFSGSLSDNNARIVYDGMMSILQPYLDSGKLVVPSGQTTLEQTGTEGWSLDKAQERAENILNGYYSDKKLNAVASANDGIGRGVANALISAGYTAGAADYPVITGQDCEIATVQYINDGKQGMSIFKDTRTLGKRAITATVSLLSGQKAESNGVTNNKVVDVATYNCELVAVTKDNYKAELVDSGYYTMAELGIS
jgi:putative multiple sugar transport system substrate-binding protein